MATPIQSPRPHYACKFCIAIYGLKGSEIERLPRTREEVVRHLAEVHGVPGRPALEVLQERLGDTELVRATASLIEMTGPAVEVAKL